MVNIFTVALKVRVNFLFGKMETICPVYVSTFEQSDFGVLAIVLFLECTVTET